MTSYEKPSPRKTTRVQIPDAANAFGVSCVNNLGYLRSEGIVF
ncbi:DUF4411 family protein [Corynebacterium aquatimens]